MEGVGGALCAPAQSEPNRPEGNSDSRLLAVKN
jgi:hypothetical protein